MATLNGTGTIANHWIAPDGKMQTFDLIEPNGSMLKLRSRTIDVGPFAEKMVKFSFEIRGSFTQVWAKGTGINSQKLEIVDAKIVEIPLREGAK